MQRPHNIDAMITEYGELQKQISLAKNYLKTRQHEKAEDILLGIIKSHKLADVYNMLGTLYSDLGKFNFAEVALKRALAINPKYMEAALNLAVLYNNLGYAQKAKALYVHLKKYGASGRGAMDAMLVAKIANMHAEIGDLYHSVGEYKEAIASYERAIDLAPKYIDIATKLATCLREGGQAKKALKIFAKYKKLAKKYSPYWVALGVSHYALGKRKAAATAWDQALQIEPRNKTAQAYKRLV